MDKTTNSSINQNILLDKQAIIEAQLEILDRNNNPELWIKDFCDCLQVKKDSPFHIFLKITFEKKQYFSSVFFETPHSLKEEIKITDSKIATVELFLRVNSTSVSIEKLLDEALQILKISIPVLKGILAKVQLEKVTWQIGERQKELKGINQTSKILENASSFEKAIREICNVLPQSMQYPDNTVFRIKYDKQVFTSYEFRESEWKMIQSFELPGSRKGTIEVFYLKQFPVEDEGPFLKEERDLLKNLAALISGAAIKSGFKKLNSENKERVKELLAINKTSDIIEDGKPVDETLKEICDILPKSWQYPKYTVSRIQYEGKQYVSRNFEVTKWKQTENFVTIDNKKGSVDIFYLREFPVEAEGPFLQEERNLLINIGKLISGYLNNFKGRGIFYRKGIPASEIHPSDAFRISMTRNKKPLQLYFNQQAIDKYIYLDMMKYKIKHILFVSTLYDAFTLESEDSFFARFMGEIYQYSLFSVPRITGVSTVEEAMELLETTRFDLVLLMAGMDREAPIATSEKIREKYESIPVYLLSNRKSDIKYYEELIPVIRSIDKMFVWSGDSLILFAIVKLTEDKVNVENDTHLGLVKVILLIEDSPLYYSKYIQMLYDIVFNHVKQLLPEVEKNELDKISRMRSRPKIMLARNYEEATAIFNKYRDFMLCVISDVEFEKAGKLDREAGVKFIRYVKSHISKLPIVLQSSENKNEDIARELEVAFVNKNSESLLSDLKHFLNSYLGFGHFVFRDKQGRKIGVAKTLREFENLLMEVPDESLELHASENQLSLWLMSRGEIQLARTLNPLSLNMFESISESRQLLIDTIQKYREEKKKGKILDWEETSVIDEKNIVALANGSLGGKGRGLAFINTLIYNLDFQPLSNQINITTPITVVIGTNEYEQFISKNKLKEKIIDPNLPYQKLREDFMEGHLSFNLLTKLKEFVNQTDKPFVVRSSSNLEDSITQPFAGVFETYLIPNGKDKRIIFEQVAKAVKMVFASTFSPKAKNYFTITHHKIEEEKMAVVIQEMVGSLHDNYYYPHISGTAQSFNYYPVSNMKPEEGFAVIAFGLGTYVVDGWKSYRFSPVYPGISIYSVKDMLNNSQVQFYALDVRKTDADLLVEGELGALDLLDVETANQHGTLKHCVSTYNYNNDSFEPGYKPDCSIVVNFSNILKYNHIPLAETIKTLLHTIQEAVGYPVEIEFAVDLNPAKNNLPSFYLLQIKPLISEQFSKEINLEKIKKQDMLLYTTSSVGNGRVNDIYDLIFIDNEKFNKLKTMEMADEIEAINKQLTNENRKYILIGPGRWGSRDKFVGIPVNWSQISNAKVIVEISLNNFPLDSSLGSHFFHNVTAMNIGYFSVQHTSSTDFIRWDKLNSFPIVNETKFYKHIRLSSPVTVLMDGKHKTSAVIFNWND